MATSRQPQPGHRAASPRPRLVAVVTDDCTGCHACIDFCLVDCIDEVRPEGHAAPSIQIRQDECIGCQLCAKVCDHLELHAIRLVRLEQDGTGAAELAEVA